GGLDLVAFLHLGRVAEQHAADVVLLEVERHAAHAARELEQLVHHAVVEAPHAGDAVAHREHRADGLHRALAAVVGDLLLEDGGHFSGSKIHRSCSSLGSGVCLGGYGWAQPSNRGSGALSRLFRRPSRRPATEASIILLSTTTRRPPMSPGTMRFSSTSSFPSFGPSAAASRP